MPRFNYTVNTVLTFQPKQIYLKKLTNVCVYLNDGTKNMSIKKKKI